MTDGLSLKRTLAAAAALGASLLRDSKRSLAAAAAPARHCFAIRNALWRRRLPSALHCFTIHSSSLKVGSAEPLTGTVVFHFQWKCVRLCTCAQP